MCSCGILLWCAYFTLGCNWISNFMRCQMAARKMCCGCGADIVILLHATRFLHAYTKTNNVWKTLVMCRLRKMFKAKSNRYDKIIDFRGLCLCPVSWNSISTAKNGAFSIFNTSFIDFHLTLFNHLYYWVTIDSFSPCYSCSRYCLLHKYTGTNIRTLL